MKFASRLKGDMAQAIVRAVLLQANYRVVDFGIEKTIRELSSLSWEDVGVVSKEGLLGPEPTITNGYNAVSAMPDFVVMDKQETRITFVEVKYRGLIDELRYPWDRDLLNNLVAQTRRFGEVVFVLMRGDKADMAISKIADMSDFMRCFVLRADRHDPSVNTKTVRVSLVNRGGLIADVTSFNGSIESVWDRAMPLGEVFPGPKDGLVGGGSSDRAACIRDAVRALGVIGRQPTPIACSNAA